jgi:hypothetical protein
VNIEHGHVTRLRRGQQVRSQRYGAAYVLDEADNGVVLALVAANGIDTGRTLYLEHGHAELIFKSIGY